jgi:hypothetical protein
VHCSGERYISGILISDQFYDFTVLTATSDDALMLPTDPPPKSLKISAGWTKWWWVVGHTERVRTASLSTPRIYLTSIACKELSPRLSVRPDRLLIFFRSARTSRCGKVSLMVLQNHASPRNFDRGSLNCSEFWA